MKKILFTAVLLLTTLSVNSQSLGWSPTEIEDELKKDGMYYEKGYEEDGDYYIYVHQASEFHLKLTIKEGICQLMTLIVFDEEAQRLLKQSISKKGSYYAKDCYVTPGIETGMDMLWQIAPLSASAKSSGIKYIWWIFYKNGPYDDITNRY